MNPLGLSDVVRSEAACSVRLASAGAWRSGCVRRFSADPAGSAVSIYFEWPDFIGLRVIGDPVRFRWLPAF